MDIEYKKLMAIENEFLVDIFLTSSKVGGTSSIYLSYSPNINVVHEFTARCQDYVDQGKLRITLDDGDSGDFNTTASTPFDVTPHCWLILASRVAPYTFAQLLDQVQDKTALGCLCEQLVALSNCLPYKDGVTTINMNGLIQADLCSSLHTQSYLLHVVASILYSSGVMGGGYIMERYPNVVSPLDHPLAAFQLECPWLYQHPGLVAFMQRANYGQLSFVVAEMSSPSGCSPGSTVIGLDPSDKAAALDVVERFDRFGVVGGFLMGALINAQGPMILLTLWKLVSAACCRVTYMPMPVLDPSQLCYPNLQSEYNLCEQVGRVAVSCGQYNKLKLKMVGVVYAGADVSLPDGSMHMLDSNQIIAMYMYSSNPFFSRFLQLDSSVQYAEDPNFWMLLSTVSKVMCLEQVLYTWRDWQQARQYEMRVHAARAYGEFLVACNVIDTVMCNDFVAFMKQAELRDVMWYQDLGASQCCGCDL